MVNRRASTAHQPASPRWPKYEPLSKKSPPKTSPDPGAFRLLIALLVLGGLAWFLADFNRVPYGRLGTLVWVGITAVAFIFGLLYYAQYLLPMPGNDGWAEGFNLLIRYYFNPVNRLFIRTPKQQTDSNDPRLIDLKALPDSFFFVDAGVLESHQVVALATRDQFSRAAGPGFVMLSTNERITHLVDLRPHTRGCLVRANSRDGIPVEAHLSLTFQISQKGNSPLTSQLIYPYNPDAIFDVTTYNSVDTAGVAHIWKNQLLPKAVTLLNDEFSQFTLDELQNPTQPPLALDEIKARIRQKLTEEAEQNGLVIHAVGVSGLTFPDPVTDQRVKRWQAEWQRKIDVNLAEGEARAARRLKQARARAQIELIEHITQSIETMRREHNANLNDIIALRMIEALEEAMAEGRLQGALPQQIVTQLIESTTDQSAPWIQGQLGDGQS